MNGARLSNDFAIALGAISVYRISTGDALLWPAIWLVVAVALAFLSAALEDRAGGQR